MIRCNQLKHHWACQICQVAWAAGCRVCRGGSHVARWIRRNPRNRRLTSPGGVFVTASTWENGGCRSWRRVKHASGPTNSYKSDELTPIIRVIYFKKQAVVTVKGHNCRNHEAESPQVFEGLGTGMCRPPELLQIAVFFTFRPKVYRSCRLCVVQTLFCQEVEV